VTLRGFILAKSEARNMSSRERAVRD